MSQGPEIIVQKRFVPRVGEGRNLKSALEQMSDALQASGYPGMELWRPIHGVHNMVVTIERYPTLGDWQQYQHTAPTIPRLVQAVFDGIYPTTDAGYDTEVLEVLGR
jgi:hypothetical protein